MKLGEVASHISIDLRKLVAYALNPNAPRGRHKALVFEQVLGYNLNNWHELQAQIESLAPEADARPQGADAYGQRYVADLRIRGVTGREARAVASAAGSSLLSQQVAEQRPEVCVCVLERGKVS